MTFGLLKVELMHQLRLSSTANYDGNMETILGAEMRSLVLWQTGAFDFPHAAKKQIGMQTDTRAGMHRREEGVGGVTQAL